MVNSIFLGIMGMGGSELMIILVLVLVIFGGSKIPSLMKGLGQGIREFKDASERKDDKKDITKT
ncbi:MAG: twin-arginine translocase TatA/TatE family subunit [Bacteroidia bacterium]|nr:twin-arginine translocase TatA/TatE family subunit [Bacteroidia bacterium]HQU99848.1 twin-arginine translocase TatA/TatE family subunit [Bacteroidia bacterium]